MTNSEKIVEAEDRVRKVLNQIPPEYIQVFYVELNKNLKNAGSNKTVADMMQENKLKVSKR
jgi:hypothetical protein